MNKQILKLFNEAGFHQPEMERLGIEHKFKQFAELIVRECIDIAQDRANFPGFPPNDVNDIINEIREHFGVEE